MNLSPVSEVGWDDGTETCLEEIHATQHSQPPHTHVCVASVMPREHRIVTDHHMYSQVV